MKSLYCCSTKTSLEPGRCSTSWPSGYSSLYVVRGSVQSQAQCLSTARCSMSAAIASGSTVSMTVVPLTFFSRPSTYFIRPIWIWAHFVAAKNATVSHHRIMKPQGNSGTTTVRHRNTLRTTLASHIMQSPPHMHPSIPLCLYPLYRLNRLTFDLDLLHESSSWAWLAGD